MKINNIINKEIDEIVDGAWNEAKLFMKTDERQLKWLVKMVCREACNKAYQLGLKKPFDKKDNIGILSDDY